MERNLDLKSSSDEETDPSNDDAGTGRSYECVFCKRGFNTAQALGGHMNIHRKDRARPRPNSTSLPSVSTRFDEDHYATNLRGYPAIQACPPPPLYSAEFNYQTFLPASGWAFRPPIAGGIYVQSPQILNLVDDQDWRRNLSLQNGPSDDHMDARRSEDGSEVDGLDLELRLGHDP